MAPTIAFLLHSQRNNVTASRYIVQNVTVHGVHYNDGSYLGVQRHRNILRLLSSVGINGTADHDLDSRVGYLLP